MKMRKFVSHNDIRAQILRLPKDIKSVVGTNRAVVIYFGSDSSSVGKVFNIDKTGTYVGGIIKFFRAYGLVSTKNEFFPKYAVWKEFKNGFNVKFES